MESFSVTYMCCCFCPVLPVVLPKLLQYFIKVTFQTGNLLLLTLFYTKKPSYVLVQVRKGEGGGRRYVASPYIGPGEGKGVA